MKSLHVDQFNHDDWAPNYDQNVVDESHPIRAGYNELLDWVAQFANTNQEILELGSGSGNLTARIRECKRMVCVDISTEMEAIALTKTAHLNRREFFASDILEVFERNIGTFDLVISTYTIHHLLDCEKVELFKRIKNVLNEGGVAVFGDLMFENESEKLKIIDDLNASGDVDVVQDIDEEFFWDMDQSVIELERLGFKTETKRVSNLSFGIKVEK